MTSRLRHDENREKFNGGAENRAGLKGTAAPTTATADAEKSKALRATTGPKTVSVGTAACSTICVVVFLGLKGDEHACREDL